MMHWTGRQGRKWAVALSGCVVCAGSWAANYGHVYFFGDSLSDTGNAYASPLPDGYATGQAVDRAGNGLWVNTFAAAVAQANDALRASAGGNNFAYGGARTGVNAAPGPLYLDQQVAQYMARSGGSADANSLYTVMMGGNDMSHIIASALGAAAAAPDAAAAQAAAAAAIGQGVAAGMASIGTQVSWLHSAGARHFLLFNAPDVLPTPRFRAQLGALPTAEQKGFFTQVGQATVSAWNTAFVQTVAALDASLGAAEITPFDLYGFGASILAQPLAYGFDGLRAPCWQAPKDICPQPELRFFWDSFHPNSRVHSLLAAEVQTALPAAAHTVPLPGSLGLALTALGLMLAFGGRAGCLAGRRSARD